MQPAEHFHFSCTITLFLQLCASIALNKLGVEGGKAFAEVLPKSSLTNLKCAAAHMLAFCVQRPLTGKQTSHICSCSLIPAQS